MPASTSWALWASGCCSGLGQCADPTEHRDPYAEQLKDLGNKYHERTDSLMVRARSVAHRPDSWAVATYLNELCALLA